MKVHYTIPKTLDVLSISSTLKGPMIDLAIASATKFLVQIIACQKSNPGFSPIKNRLPQTTTIKNM